MRTHAIVQHSVKQYYIVHYTTVSIRMALPQMYRKCPFFFASLLRNSMNFIEVLWSVFSLEITTTTATSINNSILHGCSICRISFGLKWQLKFQLPKPISCVSHKFCWIKVSANIYTFMSVLFSCRLKHNFHFQM